MSYGRRDGVAVIGEGVVLHLSEDDLAELKGVERDAHGQCGSPRSTSARSFERRVTTRLKQFGLKSTLVAKNIGYELRCADPIPFDIEYTRDLGYCAAEIRAVGRVERDGVDPGGRVRADSIHVMLDPKTGRARTRLVDIDSTRYHIARRYMIRLRKDDFQDRTSWPSSRQRRASRTKSSAKSSGTSWRTIRRRRCGKTDRINNLLTTPPSLLLNDVEVGEFLELAEPSVHFLGRQAQQAIDAEILDRK